MKQAVYSETLDIETRLRELGLSADVLREAIKRGEAHRSGCTRNDPLSFPGIAAWARTVRSLRELLIPQGWLRSDENKIPLIIDPLGRLAIAVATGNSDTGSAETSSKTKYPKGPATMAAVAKNAEQLAFDFYEQSIRIQPKRTSDCLTWVLLFRRCSGEIRCELSLPSKIGEDGRVVDWVERIILPPISLDDGSGPKIYEEEAAEDIVVEVSRRGKQV